MAILVRSATLTRYSDIAREVGLDPVRIVGQAGLDLACLYSPDLRIPQPGLAKVLEISSDAHACHSLGLMIGEAWRLSDFGPIGLLLQHQLTLRGALAEVAHYRQWLSDSVLLMLCEHDDTATLYLTLQTGSHPPGRQSVELATSVLCCLIRSILGANWRPQWVHFAHAAPAQRQAHQRVFGHHLVFGSDFNGIVLARGDLDYVNSRADINMARYAKTFLDLTIGNAPASLNAEVQQALRQLLPRGRGTIEQVSQSLGMSPRTLQRQLEQHGQTFSTVVNALRRDLATAYLLDARQTMTRTATALGFSEPSAFSRWFASQFGQSPSRWRQAQRSL